MSFGTAQADLPVWGTGLAIICVAGRNGLLGG
jgi:hypothetical protein